jgi:hypothetical protein
MMGLVDEYGNRARVIGQMLAGRQMLNICGELNCHSHYTQPVRERFNYSVFAATFYASALVQLMRHDVDAEMYWVGTEDQGGYGMMNKHGDPWPSFHAKKLVAQHVRHGDSISFPTGERGNGSIDAVVACGEGGRRSVVLIHQKEEPESCAIGTLVSDLTGLQTVLKIDASSNQIVETSYDGRVRFDGFGVAVVTTESSGR